MWYLNNDFLTIILALLDKCLFYNCQPKIMFSAKSIHTRDLA